ncbi:MAG: FAD-dependent oxidoreductase [Anaerolineae bacterium]|jgi:NADPH-dependent 2,4-dienoyl-CoA reductase/sulfur reductase-like enzyme|nr:FAD-dependent oxidoreductase [Anaerolineae bacterium]
MARRYLIVGLGAAGLAAAETIRGLDAAGEILLVSDDPHGYYSRPGLAYYLTGELAESWLAPFSEADFRQLDLRRLHARAVALHPQAGEVELDDGRRLPYDRLLLATGSRAVAPPMPGAGLQGVVKLDDMADAREILRRCRRARAAVVVGGGITALELAEGLNARKVRTHYLLRQDRYWPAVLDETESRIVEERLQKEGIHIHHGTEVSEIVGQGGRVRGVVTAGGQRIDCDVVAVAVGVRPRMELAASAGLRADRGILVDEYLQSSVPGVLAAGDVAQVFDPTSGRAVLDTLWGIAVGQGRAAGRNMAGQRVPYRKPVPFNVTRLAGLTTTIIGTVGRGRDGDLPGIARGDSETWRHHPGVPAVQAAFEVNRVRVLVGESTLRGAIVMGDQALSRPLQELVTRQADISPIRDELLRPEVRLGEVIVRFWSEGSWRNAAP